MSTRSTKVTQQTTQKNAQTKSPLKITIPRNFNVKNLKINAFEKNDKSKDGVNTQYASFCRYADSLMHLQTGWFTLTQYGITQIGKYAKTDDQRVNIKFPFDPNQESCNELRTVFESIDDVK
jgi:hypothetical protein